MKDYKACGYSATGKSHEDKGIVCQDYCCYKNGDGFMVASVADGVSNSKHSDVASRIAAEGAVKYCLQHIKRNDNTETILDTIRDAFDESLFSVKQKAKNALNDYDTTLTLAVFMDGSVYYGQIGDSGIVALCEDGKFERVTEEQKGEGVGIDRRVYPLAAFERMGVFKKYSNKVKALFLATDGVLKEIQPPLLEGQKYELDHKYLSYVFKNLDTKATDKEAQTWIEREIIHMPPTEVDYDDKTLVVLISTTVSLNRQSVNYYEYPTKELWQKLHDDYEKELYPYRYKDENTPEVKSSLQPQPKSNNDKIENRSFRTTPDKDDHQRSQKSDLSSSPHKNVTEEAGVDKVLKIMIQLLLFLGGILVGIVVERFILGIH
jgi:hypothetical protein